MRELLTNTHIWSTAIWPF